MSEQLISEPLTPVTATSDTSRMAIGELLHGEYVAGIRYISGGQRGSRIQINLPVQGGSIYVIYPEIIGGANTVPRFREYGFL